MTDLQQSPLYAHYIEDLGWTVEKISGCFIYIRRFPLLGALAKIQRPRHMQDFPHLVRTLRHHGVRRVSVEPAAGVSQKQLLTWTNKLNQYFQIIRSPFLPTKTILIDLTRPEKQIFQRFSEAKRRAVRRSLKHGVSIRQSDNITDLMHIKAASAGFFGGITTYGLDKLWKRFGPKNAEILLATDRQNQETVGGVLLLYCNRVAYYWIAAATRKGKKLFAPTLLVWEGVRHAKKRGAKTFDFVGVFDERRSAREQKNWQGFTKFKEGFGGTPVYYPTSLRLNRSFGGFRSAE